MSPRYTFSSHQRSFFSRGHSRICSGVRCGIAMAGPPCAARALPAGGGPARKPPRSEDTMAVRIVRLGTPRAAGEGLRIGTVRRPPRGVPKADWARRNFYDVWLPTLAPSEPLLKAALAAQTDSQWKAFKRRYLAEMKDPDKSRVL